MQRFQTLLIGILALSGLAHAADPPVEPLKVPPRAIEDLKFPPGTVIVVRSDPREGLGKIDSVVLSADEYKKLMERLDQQAKPGAVDKPDIPSVCRISIQVEKRGEHEIARVEARYEFNATAGRPVLLGFRRAAAVGASLDGDGLPALQSGAEGYEIRPTRTGLHKLKLVLDVPLQHRGGKVGERTFALNLPGSPITVVESVQFPGGVQTVRFRPVASGVSAIVGPLRTWKVEDFKKPAGDAPAMALGSASGVEWSWDAPTTGKPAEPLLTAEGDIRVVVSETHIQTTAAWTLKSLRGRAAIWRLVTPPGSDVSVNGASPDTPMTAVPAAADRSRWTIESLDGGVDSVAVEIVVRVPRQGEAPIGPFALESALRTQGTLWISGPAHLRVRVTKPRNDLTARDLPADGGPTDVRPEIVQAAFQYAQVGPAAAPAPLAMVDAERISGQVRTQVTHRLTLVEGGWRVVTDIKATPVRQDLDAIEVVIPPALQSALQASPPELVERIDRLAPNADRFVIRLARPRRTETTIRLEALAAAPIDKTPLAAGAAGRGEMSVALPRLAGTFDRDAQVLVEAPNGMDVRAQLRVWFAGRASEWTRPIEGKGLLSISSPMDAPAQVDLVWLPGSAVVPVESVVDMTIQGRMVHVAHRIRVPRSPEARELSLRSRRGQTVTQVRAGERCTIVRREAGEWLATIAPSPERDAEAVVHYAWPLPAPEAGAEFEAALLWPTTVRSCETRVRVWVESAEGTLSPTPRLTNWVEMPIEPAEGHESLPLMVLHGSGTDLALAFTWREHAAVATTSIVARRAFIQVVAEGNQHRYVARYRLQMNAAPWIDLEFPARVPGLGGLEIIVNGKRVNLATLAEELRPGDGPNGRIVRVPAPLRRDDVELSVAYHLPAWPQGGNWFSRMRMDLQPPRLRGPVYVGLVRWHIALPGNDFVLPGSEQTMLDQRWGLRRYLPAPVPARRLEELERWLRAGQDETGAESADDDSLANTEVVVRQGSLNSVQIVPVPRMLWFLMCSLGVLACGGLVAAVRRVRLLFWLTVTLLMALAALSAVLWPQVAMTVAAGTPPGWVVLAIVVLIVIWQAQRYRRRLVFMPGFERSVGSIELARPGSQARRREHSTVDGAAG